MAEERDSRRRLHLRNFLSPDQCKELEFIHKTSSTVGYRPNVFSTTLSHLAATNCHHLIVPLIPIREKLKEIVEEFFGCEYELCIEFTGLVSWSKGASIGWHSDDNRPYLKQRDFTAVCYLNSHGKGFTGGYFHFEDGEPATVVPSAGDLLIYTADSRNVHSVDEVTDGERLTFTLWFSRDSSHDEDGKLISRLTNIFPCQSSSENQCLLPTLASSNMYWFSRDQSSHQELGINICYARLFVLGFTICPHDDIDLSEPCDQLLKPLQLVRGDELFDYEFLNILHALQAVQYYFWKASELPTPKSKTQPTEIKKLTCPQKERVDCLKTLLCRDHGLALETFGRTTDEGVNVPEYFSWDHFSVAVSTWADYTSDRCRNLLVSLPQWRDHQSMFSVALDSL